MSSGCGIVEDGHPCPRPVEPDAPLNLCVRHSLAAYDWVARDVGVTDTLPTPCVACGSRLGVRYPSGWLCAICEWKVGDLAEVDLVTARVDVVYYLRAGDRIKIGTSGNPRGRLASLAYDELLAFEQGDRMLEQKRHSQFAEYRFAGSEWFRVHDELLEHIALLSAGVHDPWDRHRLWVSRAVALRG